MAVAAKPLIGSTSGLSEREDPSEHLMLDPRPRGEMNAMVMESMQATGWRFWAVTLALALVVGVCLVAAWGYLIAEGLGVSGANRPSYWEMFLVNTVYWIGIAHAGTFVSALLRVLKVEFRRPFTRAAELMTAFGLINVGLSVFMHLGRVWLAYWLIPYPNERGLWPNFHSPLMWDFLAISTYLIASTLYLILPLIPDLAMARDRSTGWRKIFYRILAVGFRGTEEEWTHLKAAMNIFAFTVLPIMFVVSTIVSWDFAMATVRPGWTSSIFGPYFVVGAVHSGVGAVVMVIYIIRKTMKNMKYFIRLEHFDALGKLMLVISILWAYFFFNDYMVTWYGGDSIEKILQKFLEQGPVSWVLPLVIVCNALIPWLTLWNKKVRRTPGALFSIGLLINVGMWFERYMIIPLSLTINRMPFTWRIYVPRIEIPLTIGTFALLFLLYMITSRLIPLIPVWEVQEGQMAHSLRKVGKATVISTTEIE
jgi:molybdopterin-containing oxidoreductase family membrane subunit